MNKWKKGDRLLAELEYRRFFQLDEKDNSPHELKADKYTVWVSDEFMEKAKFIEPEYEDGEWYWVRLKKYSEFIPAKYEKMDYKFWTAGIGVPIPLNSIFKIGNKIEKPEENENE